MRQRVQALFNLASLLTLAVLSAALLTAYLLRLDRRDQTQPIATGPYNVLVQRGNIVTAISGSGVASAVQVTIPPSRQPALRSSPDGSALIGFDAAIGGTGEGAWLMRPGTSIAERLPAPPVSSERAVWRAVEAQWAGNARVSILYANEATTPTCAVGRYALSGRKDIAISWTYLRTAHGRCVALSPDSSEVAVALMQAPRDGFEAQVAIRLIHVAGNARSTAMQYTGTKVPEAILWSPDGGTLVLRIPGQGLAIQKSSGRSVRVVPDGTLPASFSPRGAAIAYVSGTGRGRTVHVLNLHGEIDSTLVPPTAATPGLLAWTPDAHALIYGSANGTWQLNPVTGRATRLRMPVDSAPIDVITGGGRFG